MTQINNSKIGFSLSVPIRVISGIRVLFALSGNACTKSLLLPKLFLQLLGIAILSNITGLQGYSQTKVNPGVNKNPENSHIQWIGQYPPLEKSKTKKSVFKHFTDIVAGKSEQLTLNRPVNILAFSLDTFLIVDQGQGVVFQVQNLEIDFPRGLKKKFTGFTSLVGLCLTTGKQILFTDSHLDKVYVFSQDRKTLHFLNDSLHLNQPTGIACSSLTHEIWVVETASHRIAILDEKGNVKKRIGKRGTDAGDFNFPTHICIDKEGNAYVVDAMNFRVQIFNKDGTYVSSFGEIGDASGYFSRPKGIAVDSHGNIYVVDALFNAIQVFDKSGNLLYRFGQQGQGKSEFWMPSGIYIDNKDFIYVADTYNARIQIFKFIGN